MKSRTKFAQTRLRLLAEVIRRGISPTYAESGTPVVNQKCIRPNGKLNTTFTRNHDTTSRPISPENYIQAGDALINSTGTGTLGRTSVVNNIEDPLTWDSHVTLVRPRADRLDPQFLGYVLQMSETRFITLSQGSTNQIELSRDVVANLPLPALPLPTQRRIADYLDRETAQIDAMAGALDGLVARLEERRTNLRAIAYRKTSENHKVARLGIICESIADGPFGSSLTSAHYTETGTRLIRLGNIGVNVFKNSDRAYIDKGYAHTLVNHEARPGDVLIAGLGDKNNPVGRACVAPAEIGKSIVKADCYRVRLNDNVDPQYLSQMLNSPQVLEMARQSSRGSTRVRLTTGIASNSRIPLPPLDEQRRIADHLDAETAKIDAMIAKAGELRALLDERRSALITATVTGQHPVPKEP